MIARERAPLKLLHPVLYFEVFRKDQRCGTSPTAATSSTTRSALEEAKEKVEASKSRRSRLQKGDLPSWLGKSFEMG